MFIKGPIVWAFVLPPLVCYQVRRKWHSDFPSAWSGWIPWVASFAIFCLWVIFGIRFIDGFYEDVVLNEFAGRFHEGIHRSQPLLFYLPHLLQKFAPWSLFIIGLLVVALRKTKAATGKRLAEISPEMFWLVSWAVGGIVVMSLIPSKRVDRIFPAIPPLCLLLAAQIQAMTEGNGIRLRRVAMFAVVFAAMFTGGYSALRVIDGYRNNRDALVKFGREVRRIAVAEHLRIEVLPARDEGLLLYLQRPRFFTNFNGELYAGDHKFDGLVVPLDEEPWDSNKSKYRLTVEKKGEPPTSYGFLAPPPHR
jgi:4-amino-4-deoxy-L-arabinose transferase-like glycosyltransferase